MNALVTERNLTLDSREVAEMMGKRHADLLRGIETYIQYLDNAILRNGEISTIESFFIKSSYTKEEGGREYKCYQITQKGCEFIAHKLTGQKGTLFTAAYIDKFHEMKAELMSRKDSYMIEDPVERAKRWIEEYQEKQALLEVTKEQEELIEELKPKANYTDVILKNKNLVSITQITKDYGMSGQSMNILLHKLGIQYKQSGQWLLYSKYQKQGYTHSCTTYIVRKYGEPDAKMFTKWTQKGRLFLYELLKVNDIVPLIEQ